MTYSINNYILLTAILLLLLRVRMFDSKEVNKINATKVTDMFHI